MVLFIFLNFYVKLKLKKKKQIKSEEIDKSSRLLKNLNRKINYKRFLRLDISLNYSSLEKIVLILKNPSFNLILLL